MGRMVEREGCGVMGGLWSKEKGEVLGEEKGEV